MPGPRAHSQPTTPATRSTTLTNAVTLSAPWVVLLPAKGDLVFENHESVHRDGQWDPPLGHRRECLQRPAATDDTADAGTPRQALPTGHRGHQTGEPVGRRYDPPAARQDVSRSMSSS
jgi:hypothetical protein